MNEQKYVCPKCSELVDYGSRFCPHCGNAFGNWDNSAGLSAVELQTNYVNSTRRANKEESLKEKYFSTKGRLNRKKAIVRNLLLSVISIPVFLLLSIISGTYLIEGDVVGSIMVFLFSFIPFAIFFYSSLTINIRRCHDLNKSGMYVLATILIIPGLKLLFEKGTTGPNKYGPDPLTEKY